MRKLDLTERDVSTPGTLSTEAEFSQIRRIRDGQKECFRYFVDRYKGPIYRMALRRLRNSTDAEDVAQEAFIKAYRALPSFRFEASFFTWITRIACNEIHTRRAQNARDLARADALREQTAREPSEVTPHCPHLSQVQTQELERYRNALASLDRLYAEPLLLIAFEDRTYEEVAAVLDIPVGTVRSRLNKARRLLKEALAQ